MRFGTAGIRKIVSEEFNESTMDFIATVLSRISNTVVVGHDGRIHSDSLSRALISGLKREGVDVLFLGLAPTPVISFAVKYFGADLGVAITASHNPAEYNGIKIIGRDGRDLRRDEEIELEELFQKRLQRKYLYTGRIINASEIIRKEYIEYVLRFVEKAFTVEPCRVLFDPANGVTALYTPKILSELGHTVITVNSHIDGRFPGRTPEPSEHNIMKYIRLMKPTGTALYIGQDGDGDRVAVGMMGRYIIEDYVTAAFIKICSEKFSGSKVIMSPNISPHVYEYAESLGLRTEMRPLGYLHEGLSGDTLMASEPWKIMIKDFGLWFDGIMSAAVLSVNISAIESVINHLPKLYKTTINIKLKDMSLAGKIIENVVNVLKCSIKSHVKKEPWGIRVFSENWWVLMRPSGTEPKVRVYIESTSKELFERLTKIIRGVIDKWSTI